LALNESEKQYFNPKGFCQSFKDWDGNPTNVYEQMDADEFFNIFMDRLENLIKGTAQENVIKQHFGGKLSTELICKGCPHYSEREEPFMALSLQVKNKKSLFQSLSSFVEGEMLEGDNAYFCEECKKKVNTLRRVCLKKLPNHLICVMKRFEFDYDTMQKVKINDYCEFPMKLNIEPYTQQGLRKAEKSKKNEAGGVSEEPHATDEYPADYFEYKLTGVVIHLGSADSGHYYSLIQDQELTDIPEDKRWYEFNDTFVSRFDPKDIPSEAYGGEEKWKYYSGVDFGNLREKIKNAYLLFYERIVHHDESEFTKTKATDSKKKEEAKEDKPEDIKPEQNLSPSKKGVKPSVDEDLIPFKKEVSEVKDLILKKSMNLSSRRTKYST
jgi:ubiquitin carboxyl-terminal hydrolase 9/24